MFEVTQPRVTFYQVGASDGVRGSASSGNAIVGVSSGSGSGVVGASTGGVGVLAVGSKAAPAGAGPDRVLP